MSGFVDPFPHWIDDRFISLDWVRAVNREWPQDGWREEDGKGQRKWSQPIASGAALKLYQRFTSPGFIDFLEQLTGIEGLYSDAEQFGGGLHSVPPGGFLGVHTDFQHLPNGDRRRLNLLIYLNEGWNLGWGGDLELHGDTVKKIAPVAGRAVLFETAGDTWHGHPTPTRAPVHRRSIALYYYTKDDGVHDKTVYRR